jgi:hypothetical protein
VHPKDSVFIPYHFAGDICGLSDLFNSKEQFYCYDIYTYITTQALMCGTEVIVSSNKTTKDEFLNGYELNKYFAFGVEDLPRARSIRNQFESDLDKIEQKTNLQLQEFITKCYAYFK